MYPNRCRWWGRPEMIQYGPRLLSPTEMRERESEIRYETRGMKTKLRRPRNRYTWAQNDALWSQSSKAFSFIGLSMGNLFSDLSRLEAFHQWSHLAFNEASTGHVTIFCNFSIVMSVEANSLKCRSICARPKKWNEFRQAQKWMDYSYQEKHGSEEGIPRERNPPHYQGVWPRYIFQMCVHECF